MNGTRVSSISIDLSIQSISIKSDLPDISILIFIDLLLRANWQQKTTLHVQHTFLPLFRTTTTWNFLVSRFMEKPWMSYVRTKDFFACVICHFVLEKLQIMPHGGGGRAFIQKPHSGAWKRNKEKSEAPHTNCPQKLVKITARKITSGHLININDRTIN